jgi:hypothetical protein
MFGVRLTGSVDVQQPQLVLGKVDRRATPELAAAGFHVGDDPPRRWATAILLRRGRELGRMMDENRRTAGAGKTYPLASIGRRPSIGNPPARPVAHHHGPPPRFDGQIDEVLIYARALGADSRWRPWRPDASQHRCFFYERKKNSQTSRAISLDKGAVERNQAATTLAAQTRGLAGPFDKRLSNRAPHAPRGDQPGQAGDRGGRWRGAVSGGTTGRVPPVATTDVDAAGSAGGSAGAERLGSELRGQFGRPARPGGSGPSRPAPAAAVRQAVPPEPVASRRLARRRDQKLRATADSGGERGERSMLTRPRRARGRISSTHQDFENGTDRPSPARSTGILPEDRAQARRRRRSKASAAR